jgi:long-chain acyl-CoA synthetase
MDWWGPVVYETYGGTESLGTIATPKRWLRKPGTVGKPVRGVTVRILSESGDELPAGEIGEIWLETPAGPPEYFKDPEKSASIRRGRMVTLGDIGYLDSDGDLFLRDRKIDLIISGGVNIYPAEVESALLAAPQVADVAVIGVPDAEWGEQVVALVELKPGVAPDEATRTALLAACREQLAGFKCPRRLDFVEHLPRLPNGKIEKRRLRDLAWADEDSKI